MTIKVTPELLADIKTLLQQRHSVPYDAVLKWNRNQRRNPAGSLEGGGRFAKGGGMGHALSDIAPGHREFPSVQSGGTATRAGAGYNERNRQIAGYTSIAPGMERSMGRANYADIMNAPTGTGFSNRPRAVGPELEAAVASAAEAEAAKAREGSTKVLTVLKEGSVESSDRLSSGINASAVVEFDDPEGTKALLKPEAGETWEGSFSNSDISEYITNRDFSLAEREVVAYEIGDALFGADNPVPETVLRTSVPGVDIDDLTGGGEDEGGGYDEDYARSRYESYKEGALEDAYEAVGGEMEDLYQQAKEGHAEAIKSRAEEINEIWNEEIENFPDSPYGTGSALAEHPVLPLGSKGPFERKPDLGTLDVIEVLDKAGVDVDYELNTTEKTRVREIIRKALEDGYSELSDVDEDAAKDHLERDDFIEAHADTENRLLESKIQTFTEWRQRAGFHSDEGGGGGEGPKNPDAPHPGGGSLQRWHDDLEPDGDMSETDGARIAVLDYVLGTMDRHPTNKGFLDGKLIAIDNGYSMPAANDVDDFAFRSHPVMDWKHTDESKHVPEHIRTPIIEAINKTDWQALIARHPSMNADERTALLGRIERVRDALQTENGLYQLWRGLTLEY